MVYLGEVGKKARIGDYLKDFVKSGQVIIMRILYIIDIFNLAHHLFMFAKHEKSVNC